jgi:hypothetical protein
MEEFKPRKEEAIEIEDVLTLIKHIENPCGDSQGNNVRHVYISMAKEILLKIENPEAKKLLEFTLKKYSF